ncbi:testis-expressed sequence 10 protein isoform X2 [Canna indica]|uniref:Testis-expressed sequence 10 protein isoform X2 n=1 Tax=Canna indica TaxID=4628 RepID=A0AAQ3QF70_9LILI|nr:testis-expressed sequence 10 protein isoform X2 [Canna indica]
MVRPKSASSKKQKHGVDFKKIKRKIGRKLPPPKNATNTQIRSKAIVLPEQSVASEREGLAVNKKGLTLRELMQQTSHHNAKIRRAALTGIKDVLLKHPSELKLHKLAIIEKLRERICDNDRVVRDMLYHLLKSVIFPSSKEEITAPIISLLMAYIFNAMTHMAVDIRLMAFKFFELVALNYPSSFMLYAEKVLDNYVDILRNNQIYLVEKSKLKNALGGLAHCLYLLSNKSQEDDILNNQNQSIAQQRGLYAYKSEVNEDHAGTASFTGKTKALVPVLINSFLESTSNIRTVDVIDAQSFDCMLCTLQCISLAVKIYKIDKPHASVLNGPDVMQNNMNIYLRKLWETFPVSQLFASPEKDDDKYIILDIKIAEIFLHIVNCVNDTNFLSAKLLGFIESLLLVGKHTRHKRLHIEKHMGFLLPFIPKLLSQVTGYWKSRLLEAFTCSFKECKVDSKLFLAYLSAVEELLLVTSNLGLLTYASSCEDFLGYQIAWMREIPIILLNLGNKHPSSTRVALKLLLRVGQSSIPNSPLGIEYDCLQFPLREFYGIKDHAGSIHYGPFMKLPSDCKELAICCFYYFSSLTSDFLESVTYCCLCDDMESLILLRIVEVVQSAYKSGHVPISEYIGFLVTLVARFRVTPERFLVERKQEKVSNRKTFKSLMGAIFGCLSQMGDKSLVLKLLFKNILSEMLLKLPFNNFGGLLRMIIELDTKLSKLLDEEIADLSKSLSRYLVDAASCISEDPDVAHRFNQIPAIDYYVKPCIILFIGSNSLLTYVLQLLDNFIVEDSIVLPSEFCINYGMEISGRIHAVTYILMFMLKYVILHRSLSRNKAAIEHILLNMEKLLESDKHGRSLEETSKLRSGLDQLKTRIHDLLQIRDTNNLAGA